MAAFGLAAAAAFVALRRIEPQSSRPLRREGKEWRVVKEGFAGSESCRECHPQEFSTQSSSSHAATLRDLSAAPPRSQFGTGQGVADPDTGARYEMLWEAKKPAISVQSGNLKAAQPLHFEFGSGRRAFAYLARVKEDAYVDARLNYYSEVKRWDFTSGQESGLVTLVEQPLGRPLGASDAALCFSCHSTDLYATGSDNKPPADLSQGSELRLDLRRTVMGVHCEACHGPLGEHVRLRRSGQTDNLTTPRDGESVNALCGKCHNPPAVGPSHPGITRFQPYRLSLSKCFRQSKGRLTCQSCHNPHEDVQRDSTAYVRQCLSCHMPKRPEQKPCPVSPRVGCVKCHMPKDSGGMLHTLFTDHFIRVDKSSK